MQSHESADDRALKRAEGKHYAFFMTLARNFILFKFNGIVRKIYVKVLRYKKTEVKFPEFQISWQH